VMGNRSLDWLRQSEADLRSAATSLVGGHFEWACFAAQQAAEKAVKALCLQWGADVPGHRITQLLDGLTGTEAPIADLVACAQVLDAHYDRARFPSAHDAGAPADVYTRKEAETACECARRIIDFCAHSIRGH
jgi:HEPN domain-containing protein